MAESDLYMDIRLVKNGVWRLTSQDGGIYYAKRMSPIEREMTLKASSFDELPEGAIVQLPKVLTTELTKLPSNIRAEITGYDFGDTEDNARMSEFVLLEASPAGVAIGNDEPTKFSLPLQGKPLTTQEFDVIVRDLRILNAHGIHNGDILSNLALSRDSSGVLRACTYDYDPTAGGQGFAGNTQNPDDAADVLSIKGDLEKIGVLNPRH